MLMLNEDSRLAVDRKEVVTILSTDMSKAFDSLSHSLTLKELDAYGFNSSSLELDKEQAKQSKNKWSHE